MDILEEYKVAQGDGKSAEFPHYITLLLSQLVCL